MTNKNLENILPYALFIITILTFLFGEDITGKLFSNANLVMETKVINQYIPDELEKVIKESSQKSKNNSADSLRIINIKNEGKATKNLRVLLKLEGPVSYYKSESTEVIKDKKGEEENTIVLSLDRLANNATIELKVWFKNENKPFAVSYADDISNKVISVKNQQEIVYTTIFYTTVAIIFIISIILILNNIYRKLHKKRKEAEQNSVVERVLSELSESIEEESNQEEEYIKKRNDLIDTDKTKERLRELIRKKHKD